MEILYTKKEYKTMESKLLKKIKTLETKVKKLTDKLKEVTKS